MRRTVHCACEAFPQVPPLNDWSRFATRFAPMVNGRQFDKTVLEPGIVPTQHLQRGLLRLPIPKLDGTLDRYLKAVQPLVTQKDFGHTTSLVETFRSGAGKMLQDYVVQNDKANPGDSYISGDWFELYLRDRQALPINYNPSLITRNDNDKTDGLTRAAFWIASSIRWHSAYQTDQLKPEVFWFCKPDHYCRRDWFQRTVALAPESIAAKVLMFGSQFQAFPLDMSQYDSLFSTTRIPRQDFDEIRRSGPSNRHIVVNYRGHQFKVTVADEQGAPLSEGQIYARLKAITELGLTAADHDVGVLTADTRDEWAAVRQEMERLGPNKKSFEAVDSALFVLNLDLDTTADLLSGPGANTIGKHLLAAPNNRWWDKSLSVTVTQDGVLGVEFEHSWGDGVAVLRYTVDTFNDSIGRSAATMERNVAPTEAVTALTWELGDSVKARHAKVLKSFQSEIDRMDYFTTVMDAFGKKDKIFRGKVKPDPFMQLAMQLAWWRLNKSTVSTYESASTAAFKRGRTECIRSATLESQRFTMIFDSPTASDADKMAALLAATAKQGELAKEAKMGSGVDRHLFALRKQAERSMPPTEFPELFKDPSYATLGSNIISTSSLFSDALVGGGFGPVSAGYGVGYAAANDMMVFNISSWKTDGPMNSSEEFARAVYASALDMKGLMDRVNPGA